MTAISRADALAGAPGSELDAADDAANDARMEDPGFDAGPIEGEELDTCELDGWARHALRANGFGAGEAADEEPVRESPLETFYRLAASWPC